MEANVTTIWGGGICSLLIMVCVITLNLYKNRGSSYYQYLHLTDEDIEI